MILSRYCTCAMKISQHTDIEDGFSFLESRAKRIFGNTPVRKVTMTYASSVTPKKPPDKPTGARLTPTPLLQAKKAHTGQTWRQRREKPVTAGFLAKVVGVTFHHFARKHSSIKLSAASSPGLNSNSSGMIGGMAETLIP